MQERCILRVVGETIQIVGYVFADDETMAISDAIKKFDLIGRDLELVAHRVPQTATINRLRRLPRVMWI
jgi:hypothetical protein